MHALARVRNLTLFVAALIPLVAGPDTPHPTTPSASLTMTFVVMGLGTVFNALTNRRDPTSGPDVAGAQGARHLAVPARDARSWPRSCPALQKG